MGILDKFKSMVNGNSANTLSSNSDSKQKVQQTYSNFSEVIKYDMNIDMIFWDSSNEAAAYRIAMEAKNKGIISPKILYVIAYCKWNGIGTVQDKSDAMDCFLACSKFESNNGTLRTDVECQESRLMVLKNYVHVYKTYGERACTQVVCDRATAIRFRIALMCGEYASKVVELEEKSGIRLLY